MLKDLWLKFRYYAIAALLVIVFLCTTLIAVKSCIDYKNMNENNIEALTDSIKYYTDKSGDLVAMKTLLEGDMSTLKAANEDLYNTIKSMKVSNPSNVVYMKTTVDNPNRDTIWSIKDSLEYIVKSNGDTVKVLPKQITKDFAFNNEYRSLEGKVSLTDTLLGVNISKDQVYLDYTLAIKDSKVYVKSNNPYVKYNEIQGLTIPKSKSNLITIGPSVGYGYNFGSKKFGPFVGATVTWNLIKLF